MEKLSIKTSLSNISDGVIFIEKNLRESNRDSKKVTRTVLICEELLVKMITNSPSEDGQLDILIKKTKKSTSVKISCKGDKFSLEETHTAQKLINIGEMDDNQTAIINAMIINAYSDNISLKYRNGINTAFIDLSATSRSDNKVLILMILGIIAGMALRMVLPEIVTGFISDNIFSVIQTLFMNAIKMIVAPLVFFSIADSMTGFSDYRTFGRIGAKVIGFYFFTTFFAIMIAYGLFCIFTPGDPSQVSTVLEVIGNAPAQTVAEVSIKSTIIDIIPSNMLAAFVNANMLQIIFIGIFVGIVSGILGNSSERIQCFIKDGNALFAKMTAIISKFMPYAIFCIMASLAISISLVSLMALIKAFATTLLALFCMIIFYMILLVSVGKLNPFIFFKKYKDAIIVSFTTASSNVTMPTSMSCLGNMGVSKKVYGFSIPLGATINMDGTSVHYIIVTLFMMRIFDIPTSPGQLLTIFVSVMLLSVGTPGIPGASIACTAMLFAQVGIAPEAVGYILAMATIGEFFRTSSNVIGDAVVTTIVASSENMLDRKKYNA